MGKILLQIDTGKTAIADPEGNSSLDGMTAAINTIEYEHHEVHEGNGFVVSDVQNVNTTTMKWMVTTGMSKEEFKSDLCIQYDITPHGSVTYTWSKGDGW